jgi:hypothetical protein
MLRSEERLVAERAKGSARFSIRITHSLAETDMKLRGSILVIAIIESRFLLTQDVENKGKCTKW